jgi:hypothetical protein
VVGNHGSLADLERAVAEIVKEWKP